MTWYLEHFRLFNCSITIIGSSFSGHSFGMAERKPKILEDSEELAQVQLNVKKKQNYSLWHHRGTIRNVAQWNSFCRSENFDYIANRDQIGPKSIQKSWGRFFSSRKNRNFPKKIFSPTALELCAGYQNGGEVFRKLFVESGVVFHCDGSPKPCQKHG